jgi:hypothetical protein
MKNDELNILCAETERISGIKILTFSDAERLSNLLKYEKHHLSPHTIARLFGVFSEKRKHYRNTLSILANYIGFKDYDDFVMSVQSGYFHPLYIDYNREFDQFIILLELYMEMNDYDSVFSCIENMTEDQRKFGMFKIAHLLGKIARQNSYSEQFILSIKKFPRTNKLLLNTWIDEDYTHNGYLNYLKSNLSTDNEDLKAFIQSLEITSIIYSNVKINKTDFSTLPYSKNAHVFSRQLEVSLLEKGLTNKTKKEILYTIESEINNLRNFTENEILWLLGRILRASAYLNLWNDLKMIYNFDDTVQNLLNRKKSHLSSVGEGIVQAYAMSMKLDFKLLFLPTNDVLNEQRNKFGLNAFFLYKSDFKTHQSELASALGKYAKTPHMSWLKGCLEMK